ncbi:amidohydrolase family protein [Mucilaginibacter jinjuensis]|uniref:Amidohydrolase family protein n=1 Tax=Mucilaginibacter jinjuensis TaxID=1176721 RepID=A0ABY7TDJ3_9SPHI|nr:amidohydrolase family protein [Mucilaginibacter jinjuensis]WCT14595.1 amidohydrolase family protein [Mucilaginibacter jinjuensis]
MIALNNLHLINGHDPVNIGVEGKLITSVNFDGVEADELTLNFSDAMALPGLINSHDHLDFNLFPQLGDLFYRNYTEWGKHIHQHYKQQIQQVLKVPVELRAAWGVYKNLLGGVTTVVDHSDGPKYKDELINVVQAYHCLHSVQFEKHWRRKLNNPLKLKHPYVIHTGEGVDELAHQEIDELLKGNYFKKKLIGIHGVAMKAEQAERFEALVWCPQSNYFLLNQTADIKNLKQHTPILFGTDSTLTSEWNIWGHLRLAAQTKHLSAAELWMSVTTSPAKTWRLNTGELAPGKDADIVIAKDPDQGYRNLYSLNPEDLLLVMYRGRINLFDEEIYQQLEDLDFPLQQFDRVKIGNAYKYIAGGVTRLMEHIKTYYPKVTFPILPA